MRRNEFKHGSPLCLQGQHRTLGEPNTTATVSPLSPKHRLPALCVKYDFAAGKEPAAQSR